MDRIAAPRDLEDLRARAHALAGRSVEALARDLGVPLPPRGLRGKGKVGTLIERALGATAGASPRPDFPHLGVELKTIPVGPAGEPLESTFVCTLTLADADRASWDSSRARAKLAHVVWIPVIDGGDTPTTRRLGTPVFWRPTAEQERVLRDDFDELLGIIGSGRIEALTARDGRWLQVRPKAATGRVRTLAFGRGGERIATVPRGFYLRARFTAALLRDPTSVPP